MVKKNCTKGLSGRPGSFASSWFGKSRYFDLCWSIIVSDEVPRIIFKTLDSCHSHCVSFFRSFESSWRGESFDHAQSRQLRGEHRWLQRWDLMITNVRWHALVDQAEIPLFQILHKVGFRASCRTDRPGDWLQR